MIPFKYTKPHNTTHLLFTFLLPVKQVRIWAWDNPEHQLKIEVFGLGGAVKDLAWGPESKRIVCCGAGSGVNARAFMWDTGSNLGEVVGHSKRVISCDYRQVRPYRIMTGSEDHRTIFYQGPPFKMDHSNNTQHTNFVNCVRFSPDGSKIATCSSDRKVGYLLKSVCTKGVVVAKNLLENKNAGAGN